MKLIKPDPREQAEREAVAGSYASQVLGNPLYKEFMIAARADLFSKLENTKFKNRDERDEIWRKLQTLKNFEHWFVTSMQTGKMGEQKLSMLDKAKKRLR